MTRTARIPLAALLALVLLLPAGCGTSNDPVRDSRSVLGTMVTIEAYGPSDSVVRAAIDDAFDQIDLVEQALNSYSTTSAIAAVNATPFESHQLPSDAVEIIDRVQALGVGGEFSPYLLGEIGRAHV